MSWAFIVIAVITLVSAVGAVSLRNLVHCALSLTVTFAGLAAFYLQLNAQFVGFVQLLVYVGAVAILIVFAILLTRPRETEGSSRVSSSWWIGVLIAGFSFACLVGAILSSKLAERPSQPAPVATVSDIGAKLMGEYVLPLEVMALLLTAALVGGVVIGLRERRVNPKQQ